MSYVKAKIPQSFLFPHNSLETNVYCTCSKFASFCPEVKIEGVIERRNILISIAVIIVTRSFLIEFKN